MGEGIRIDMDVQTMISHEKGRGDCYRLLAACFYPPRKEIFLKEHLLENLTLTLGQVFPDAVSFSQKMEKGIFNYTEEELSVEYARLFVGPFELKAPPYGSIYLDGERRVMGDSTMEVIRLYQEAGLVMDKDFKDLPDHIAVELEFMNYLIYREIETHLKSKIGGTREDLKNQQIFLKKYLGTWVPVFSKAIIENSNNLFYINLAKCTAAFIKTDMDHISSTLRKIS